MKAFVLMAGISLLLAPLLAFEGAAGDQKEADKYLRATAKKIQKDTKLSDAQLEEELNVVLAENASMTAVNLKQGIDAARTTAKSEKVWMRSHGIGAAKDSKWILKPDEKLTQKHFRAYSARFGYLTVTSEPTKAKVTVKSIPWGETKTEDFEEEGEYPIVIEKDGYRKYEGTVKVEPGKQTFHKKLEKN